MSITMVAQVRDFSKSRGDARFLLTILASYVNPHTGWAWPSLATLAHTTTKGKPYLLKLIRALEDLGELEVRRGCGRGHSNHYRITICHEPPPDTPRKGNPRENLFPTEKVIGDAEKVIEVGQKGNRSGYPKEVLRTRKEILQSPPVMKTCARDGCTRPQCPHWQQCREHACCELCAVADTPSL